MMKKPKLRERAAGVNPSATTIHDVARLADVSPMTVSRVINGAKNVRDTTRASVLSAIKELQYAPNAAARSLAGAGATRIGLLYSNPSSAYLSEFLIGALDEASRSGAQLLLEKCEADDPASELAAAQKLIKGGVAAIILPPPLCESVVILEELHKASIPAVSVATGRFRGDASSVRIDDFRAAYEMTRYLLRLGHRRIGFIVGHPNQTASGIRQLGFETAMREAAVKVAKTMIVQGYFSYRSGLVAAEKLLSRKLVPTAIFSSNDDMAAAVISVAHRKGLDVPRDLSVVGFDDTTIATSVWPELTTIRQPVAAMAEIALEMVVREIRGRKEGEKIQPLDHLVAHTLIERQSAGPPRAP